MNAPAPKSSPKLAALHALISALDDDEAASIAPKPDVSVEIEPPAEPELSLPDGEDVEAMKAKLMALCR